MPIVLSGPPLGISEDRCKILFSGNRDPRASADAESARNDLPRAPCPQDILKVRPPNSLDYRARYDTPALEKNRFQETLQPILFY